MKNSSKEQSPLYLTLPSIVWQQDIADQFFVGDIDGDGLDEIIVFNPYSKNIAALRSFHYGELSDVWKDDKQIQLITFWHASDHLFSSANEKGFILDKSLTIYFADIDGDGQNEVIFRNTNCLQLLVMKWAKNEKGFYQFNQLALFQNQLSEEFPLEWGDQLYFADLTGNGAQEMIILNSLSGPRLQVFDWQSADQTFNNKSSKLGFVNYDDNPNGYLGGEVKLVFVDLTGTGKSALCGFFVNTLTDPALNYYAYNETTNSWDFFYGGFSPSKSTFDLKLLDNPTSKNQYILFRFEDSPTELIQIGYWDAEQSVMVYTEIKFPDQIKPDTRLYIINSKSNLNSNIVLYYPTEAQMVFYQLVKNEYQVIKKTNGYLDAPQNCWKLTPDDHFCFGNFYDKNRTDIFASYSSQKKSHALFSITDQNATSLEIQNYSFAQNFINAYCIELITKGPSHVFSKNPFVGQQLKFYDYINTKVNNGNAIRGIYNKSNHKSFQSLINAIKKLHPPSGVKKNNSDWKYVTEALISELRGVKELTNLIPLLNQKITDTQTRMNEALNTIKGIKYLQPEASSGVLFWFEQIFIAALWGAAAAVSGGAAIGLSIGASIMGTLTSAFSEDGDPPITIDWDKYQTYIYNKIITAREELSSNFYDYFIDGNKLTIFSNLMSDGQPWNTNLVIANQAEVDKIVIRNYQISFIQNILVQLNFNVVLLINDNSNLPSLPEYDYFTRPNPIYDPNKDYGNYRFKNIHFTFLFNGDLYPNRGGDWEIPNKELLDVLFKDLKIEEDFILYRRLGWKKLKFINMPQMNIGEPGQNG